MSCSIMEGCKGSLFYQLGFQKGFPFLLVVKKTSQSRVDERVVFAHFGSGRVGVEHKVFFVLDHSRLVANFLGFRDYCRLQGLWAWFLFSSHCALKWNEELRNESTSWEMMVPSIPFQISESFELL